MYRLHYKDYMQATNDYLIRNRVNEHLCKRVANLLRFRWEYNENVSIFGI